MKKLNDVKNDVNVDVKMKYNLDKYNEIIEGSDSDVLTQYETWYDQLSEVVINNNNTINQSQNIIQQFNEFIEMEKKEEENNDEIKFTLNLLVDKMIDKETIIFNKNEDEFKKQAEEKLRKESDQRKQEFDEKLKELNGMRCSYDTNVRNSIDEMYSNDTRIQQDKEIVELIPSFNKLKEWSGKQKCSVVFDSKIHGDGKRILLNKIWNKSNLYFITFDNENNVFGGYINIIINKNYWITDSNAFTFSLMRNGKMNNTKYNIKNDQQQNTFHLQVSSDWLYAFGGGNDIFVNKIGNINSHCSPSSYEYNGDQHPFIDKSNFITKRILVIQMN